MRRLAIQSLTFLLFLTCFIAKISVAQSISGGKMPAIQGGFSGSIVVHDGTLFVGEPDNTLRAGTVYAYTGQGGEWVEAYRFTAGDGRLADGFGTAMAVSGNTLAVTALNMEDGAGAVYLFDLSGMQPVQQARLVASDTVGVSNLGTSIAFSGNTLVVGAPNVMEEAGKVYVFDRKASGGWSQSGMLSALIPTAGERFGMSLAMAGNWVMVGAPMAGDRAGTVHVFERTDNEWRRGRELSASGIERNSQFGASLYLEDGLAMVGAPSYQRSVGLVWTFEWSEDNGWSQADRLMPFDAATNARFGWSVARVGNAYWIGAPRADRFSGAVYVVSRNDDGSFASSTKIQAPEDSRGSAFGSVLAVDGDLAVIGMPNKNSGGGAASVRNRADGSWSEVSFLQGPREALDSVTGGQVECKDGESGLFDCDQVDMVSFLSVKDLGAERGITVNDIWGWTDPVTGQEWALVGRRDGTSFVDVSDPYNPVYAGNLPKSESAHASTWRDIKTYKDHAYIVADGAGDHGMQVFDLTRLRDVNDMPVTFSEDALYDKIASAHNIVIDEDTGFAYSVGSSSGGETCGGGLHMIDIRDPENPQFAGCYADAGTGRSGTGYTHDAMCFVYHGPDADYSGHELCFGSNETALSIADVTDKSAPKKISSAEYPNVGYAHQGWITQDHRFFFLDDELDELQNGIERTRTMVWDVTDLDDPQLVKEYFGPTASSDHNLYIRGNTMYQSNYQSGLRVVDISDPVNPVEVGYFDTVPYGDNSAGFGGSWSNYPFFESGIIVVTSGSEGLFVLKKTNIDI